MCMSTPLEHVFADTFVDLKDIGSDSRFSVRLAVAVVSCGKHTVEKRIRTTFLMRHYSFYQIYFDQKLLFIQATAVVRMAIMGM